MSGSTSWWRRAPRRRMVVGASVVGVAAIGGALWLGLAGADDGDAAAATPSASPTPSATAEATPEPTATETPAPAETAPADTVSAPADGDIPDQTPVEPREVVELPAVGLTETADFGNAVSARLLTTSRVDGVGQGVGERSGPSMLVTVEITNASSADVDLDYVVVNLYGPENAPGQLLLGDSRSAPMSGILPPGEVRTGSYVMRLPDSAGSTVKIEVSYGAEVPTAIFSGDVPA
ncbi:hypothetical protein [Pengzhenrongella sicca]|uniref:DUF4352 domain-containing protein n=1 Tax=Pengzhenrongella sicca TaxID=2819238 RepID=A0A8A4ZEH9_9MICO|nr:hypothetical protein [Pengzhenrongella sicca]QTE28897.1 hypothetical protein J4E96_16445 [Pengzhenrongella sicca]